MISDIDRNSRTLIICFIIAVIALIPLRFVELGQDRELMNAQVLGESMEVELIEEEENEGLPIIRIEAPYDEIDIIR